MIKCWICHPLKATGCKNISANFIKSELYQRENKNAKEGNGIVSSTLLSYEGRECLIDYCMTTDVSVAKQCLLMPCIMFIFQLTTDCFGIFCLLGCINHGAPISTLRTRSCDTGYYGNCSCTISCFNQIRLIDVPFKYRFWIIAGLGLFSMSFIYFDSCSSLQLGFWLGAILKGTIIWSKL